jgi:alkylresorcinol/alkylpyrone synthase
MSTHPRLLSIATTAPAHVLKRADVVLGARQVFAETSAEFLRLLPIYVNAGVDERRSCVPLSWFFTPHGWAERNALFVEHALDLLEEAARQAIEQAGLAFAAIDAIVVVSSSGVTAPSLDARLMERLPFRRDVLRLPIFGLGCAGGVLGLARAAAMAQSQPGHHVLLLVVELCGLTFRPNDQSKGNLVATALFGDGAAALVIGPGDQQPALVGWGEHTWPQSLDVMGWRVEDDGFGVLFSQRIPQLIHDSFGAALDAFLERHHLTRRRIDRYLCHPGGTKVVAALEHAIGLAEGSLTVEREVLRTFGNMSAATLLFVIQRALAKGVPGRSLATALGPGFTAGFVLLEAP